MATICLFSDFGVEGPYMGQMAYAAQRVVGGRVNVLSLMADAPMGDPIRAGYLLAAMAQQIEPSDVVVAVVDPGVGTQRQALWLTIDGREFIGPDNGLFAPLIGAAESVVVRCIDWRPERLSSSFHGRDLFAPFAAMVAMGEPPAVTALQPETLAGVPAPPELGEVIYIDHFGNLITGYCGALTEPDVQLHLAGRAISKAATFADVPPDTPFWYINSHGLIEVAVNRGSAKTLFNADIGQVVGRV